LFFLIASIQIDWREADQVQLGPRSKFGLENLCMANYYFTPIINNLPPPVTLDEPVAKLMPQSIHPTTHVKYASSVGCNWSFCPGV
jgi:hypothetical protein